MAETAEQTAKPPTAGRWTYLRPVFRGDYDLFYAVDASPQDGPMFRNRGIAVPPEEYGHSLWAGVLAQFVVCRKTTKDVVGLTTAYGADFRNGHCRVAGLILPKYRGLAWPMEGFLTFHRWLFEVFPFRKLYGEVPEFNLPQIGRALGRGVVEEGRLKEHEYYRGRYWDLVTVALYRDAITGDH